MSVKKKVGIIELGEEAYMSDPTYSTNNELNCTIKTFAGKYNVFITKSQGDFDNGRISNLYAIHQDFYKGKNGYKRIPQTNKEYMFCCVDSGTCGIFDKDYFEKYHNEQGADDEWYEKFVMGTISKEYVVTDGLGAFSLSGWGDGKYIVNAEYKEGKAFAINIKFF